MVGLYGKLKKLLHSIELEMLEVRGVNAYDTLMEEDELRK